MDIKTRHVIAQIFLKVLGVALLALALAGLGLYAYALPQSPPFWLPATALTGLTLGSGLLVYSRYQRQFERQAAEQLQRATQRL
ncbi:hypothetical protein HP532_24250, partial [Pseudomonas sp. CrR25]|nr:hypothetical protein [Pseudomonas sp. CrR25]